MNFAIPVNCIYSMLLNVDRDFLLHSGSSLLVPFLSLATCFVLSAWIGKLLHLSRKQFGVFVMMCSVTNAVFVGYPMCIELFGDTAVPYIMLFYFGNTVLTQTVGISLVRYAGHTANDLALTIYRIVKTPTILAITAAVILSALNVHLPSVLNSFGHHSNSCVTPMALFLMGYIIYEHGVKNITVDRSLS